MTFAVDRDAEQANRTCLAEALRWAVPLRMLELRGLGSDQARRRRLPPSVPVNLHRCDALMFKSNWKNTALAFDAFAWALAYLAYSPGGVEFLGVHWCAGDHPGCPHATRPALEPAGPWWEPLAELEALARAEGWPHA